MSTTVKLKTNQMVGAANVGPVLAEVPGLPEVSGVTCRGLEVTITFADTLDASQVTAVKAIALTLPLAARIIRYSKVASEQCGQAITSGLWSDVTGTNLLYDSDMETQLNLVGAVLSGTDTFWHVREHQTGPKLPVRHTTAQLVGVGQAIKQWKEDRIYVFQTFRARLQACTTTMQCDELMNNWDPYADPSYPTT